MRGGDNLYYFDKGELKLVDISVMNKLIKKYPTLRQETAKIAPYSFKPEMSQQEQTLDFAKNIELDVSQLEGVCIE